MQKQTQEVFICKSKFIFGTQLNYDKVIYINSRTEIILTCNLHGDFLIKPKDHISYKRSCSICSGVKYNTESFIKKAKSIHGNLFDYKKSVFTNVKHNLIIICKIKNHGAFKQKPDKHINAKQGCPKCKKSSRKNLDYAINQSNKIHHYKYNYSKSIFTRMFDDIIIICKKHGEFKKTPANHIHGQQGCPSCIVSKSNKEKLWLDYIKVPIKYRNKNIKVNNRRFQLDAFNKSKKIIYEFYGDYWHGNIITNNPNKMNVHCNKTYQELYNETINRENILKSAGYQIISIWESDFDKLKINA